MSTPGSKTNKGMEKAFASVRGALKRGNAIELRCKRVWLEAVVKKLPGTDYFDQAELLIKRVNDAIAEIEDDRLLRPS